MVMFLEPNKIHLKNSEKAEFILSAVPLIAVSNEILFKRQMEKKAYMDSWDPRGRLRDDSWHLYLCNLQPPN